MDNRIGAVLIAALAITIIATIVGFSYLQGEINSLKPQTTAPTAHPAMNQANPTETPINTPQPTQALSTPTNSTQKLRYTYVNYEFTLKTEYINNTDWLRTQLPYNSNLSWKDNYIAYLSNFTTYPDQMRDSMASFMFNFDIKQFVSAEFDAATGKTKATYSYIEYNGVPEINSIENALPSINDGQGWNKAYE